MNWDPPEPRERAGEAGDSSWPPNLAPGTRGLPPLRRHRRSYGRLSWLLLLGGSVLIAAHLESLGTPVATAGFGLGIYSLIVWFTTPPSARKAVIVVIATLVLFLLVLVGLGVGLSKY